MAGLPTSGAEAWIIWIWHGERVGSLPLLTLGRFCVILPLAKDTHFKMGGRDLPTSRHLK